MGTICLAYPNRAPSATLSGGNWQTGLAPLQTRALAEVARSAGLTLAATQLDVDLGRHRAVSFIALVRHNLSLAGSVRITIGSTAGGADLYDSGWQDVWPAVRPLPVQGWFAPNWWHGKLTDEERALVSADHSVLLPLPVLARYLRIEIDDQANPAGYVEAGMLFIADGWRPAVNIDWGYSLAWQDKTAVEEADSGMEFFGQKARRRRASFRLSHMSTDEAMGRAFDLDGQLGISGDLYYFTDTDDLLHKLRRSFLGRLEQTSEISHASYDRHGKAFQLIERIA